MEKKRNSKGQFEKGDVKDITGQRFSHLVVLKLDHIKDKRSYWLCQCDCGNQKVVRSDCLKVIQSCGCIKKQQDIINLGITYNHNMTHHPAFNIWTGIIQRCTNPNSKYYKDYGGRGIKVCEEWIDPKLFCQWADETGYKPNCNLSIERIDVNGNYEPSNCIWIPRNEQNYNKRNTLRFVDDDGVEKPVALEARKRGISPKLATERYKRGERNPRILFHKGSLKKDFPLEHGGKGSKKGVTHG